MNLSYRSSARTRTARGPAAPGVALTTSFLAVLLCLAVMPALASRAEAFVYWTEINGEKIGRANRDGTGVDKRFITAPGSFPAGVAVDAKHVYWANDDTPGTIGRANLDGTGVEPNFITGAGDAPFGVAVDAAHVYWVDLWGGAIGRANLDGTSVERSFIAGAADRPCGVAVDAGHVYWTDDRIPEAEGAVKPPNPIGRANLDGTGVEPGFIADAGYACHVAVDAGHVYWDGIDAIGRANLDGTRVEESFIPGVNACGVAVDASHVYWATWTTPGKIGRANLDGTGVDRSFIPGAGDGPCPVAVDALRSFSLGKVKRNKGRGTARLTARVPARGAVKLARTESVKGAKERADTKGKVRLSVMPRGKAKEDLKRRGRAKVKAKVTYIPRGGNPNIVASTLTEDVRLIKRGN